MLMATIHSLVDEVEPVSARPNRLSLILFTDDPPLQKEAWRLDQWWLVVDGGEVELCLRDPGYEIDVFVTTDLRTFTRYYIGDFAFRDAARSGAIEVTSPKPLVDAFERWMPRSHFGQVPRPPEPLDLQAVISRSPAKLGDRQLDGNPADAIGRLGGIPASTLVTGQPEPGATGRHPDVMSREPISLGKPSRRFAGRCAGYRPREPVLSGGFRGSAAGRLSTMPAPQELGGAG